MEVKREVKHSKEEEKKKQPQKQQREEQKKKAEQETAEKEQQRIAEEKKAAEEIKKKAEEKQQQEGEPGSPSVSVGSVLKSQPLQYVYDSSVVAVPNVNTTLASIPEKQIEQEGVPDSQPLQYVYDSVVVAEPGANTTLASAPVNEEKKSGSPSAHPRVIDDLKVEGQQPTSFARNEIEGKSKRANDAMVMVTAGSSSVMGSQLAPESKTRTITPSAPPLVIVNHDEKVEELEATSASAPLEEKVEELNVATPPQLSWKREELEKLLLADAKNAAVSARLGILYWENHDSKNATDAFNSILANSAIADTAPVKIFAQGMVALIRKEGTLETIRKARDAAFKQIKEAYDLGFTDAAGVLGLCYLHGIGVQGIGVSFLSDNNKKNEKEESEEKMIDLLKKSDDPLSLYTLGECYRLKQQYSDAKEYFIRAADLGYQDALKSLVDLGVALPRMGYKAMGEHALMAAGLLDSNDERIKTILTGMWNQNFSEGYDNATLYRQGRRQKTEEFYVCLRGLYEDNPTLLINLISAFDADQKEYSQDQERFVSLFTRDLDSPSSLISQKTLALFQRLQTEYRKVNSNESSTLSMIQKHVRDNEQKAKKKQDEWRAISAANFDEKKNVTSEMFFWRGCCYECGILENGRAIPDDELARYNYQEAAKLGSRKAYAALARLQEYGGVDSNRKSLVILMQAAERKDSVIDNIRSMCEGALKRGDYVIATLAYLALRIYDPSRAHRHPIDANDNLHNAIHRAGLREFEADFYRVLSVLTYCEMLKDFELKWLRDYFSDCSEKKSQFLLRLIDVIVDYYPPAILKHLISGLFTLAKKFTGEEGGEKYWLLNQLRARIAIHEFRKKHFEQAITCLENIDWNVFQAADCYEIGKALLDNFPQVVSIAQNMDSKVVSSSSQAVTNSGEKTLIWILSALKVAFEDSSHEAKKDQSSRGERKDEKKAEKTAEKTVSAEVVQQESLRLLTSIHRMMMEAEGFDANSEMKLTANLRDIKRGIKRNSELDLMLSEIGALITLEESRARRFRR